MNARIATFIFAILVIISVPLYWFVDTAVSGGVKDRGDFLEVNLKAMSTFEMDQTHGRTTDVPERWRALNGKRISVEGEMWDPKGTGDRLAEFELVYSIAKCCFSGPPQIQHFVLGKVPEGRQVNYYQGPVRVTGTLRVDVQNPDGNKVTRVYTMEVERVDPI